MGPFTSGVTRTRPGSLRLVGRSILQVDDDFIAKHNAEYGFSEDLTPIEPKPDIQPPVSSKPAKKNGVNEEKKEPEWFQVDHSHDTHAYVSGLPADITEDEFVDMMTKYGIIMEDSETNSNGCNKGDGLCCYLRHESVELAIDILDDSELRGHKIHVDYATFELKGEFDPTLKTKKRKKKGKSNQDKLLDWNERDQYKRGVNRRACVIHYLFEPGEFLNDPAAIIDYKSELTEECSKFGEIKKVFIFERSEDGVASILFKDEESAEKCIQVNKCYFIENGWSDV
ncbi:HIV Tat-specific factor 1 [Thelohanellus kitauei]|uniref:HIV Tat-specific factor 1 n=1 Tax=Thelohanellus kitauei TaxID=669202 RepID=A0A0C2N1A6_THEKT|nr:HIV Tat-specific factor 1 [Thelohanellus kitauei]